MKNNNLLSAAVQSLWTGRPISFLFYRGYRLLLKCLTPYARYPREVKNVKPETVFPEELMYQLSVKARPRDSIKSEVFQRFDRLQLAGVEYPFGESIDWWPEFEDGEDLESLHRWNWLLYMLSGVGEDGFSALVFKDKAKVLIDSWHKNIVEMEDEIEWDAYSCGERICNLVIFSHFAGLQLSDFWKDELSRTIYFVIDNLEYAGSFTGNHVFNNARAVYLAGCAFNQSEWRDFARTVVLREIRLLLTEDGFLRESSSHYHFLFTRWILELMYFADLANDTDFKKDLSVYATLAVNKCWFFLVFNSSKKDWDLPLIGDVSPDFTPDWLKSLPWSECAMAVYEPEKFPDLPKTPGWANIFGLRKQKLTEKGVLKSGTGIRDFKKSGWFRIDAGRAVLIWYAPAEPWRHKANHAHCDTGSFCFYLDGAPVLTDSGRLRYTDDVWGRYGLQAAAHNTICVDGEGCFPEVARHYPEVFNQDEIHCAVRQKGDIFEAVISFKGFYHCGKPIVVRRKFILTDGELLLEDEISGKNSHTMDLWWHFAEGVECLQQDDQFLVMRTPVGKLNMAFERSRGKKFEIKRYFGGDDPHGWVVSAYGKKQPALTVQSSFAGQLPVTVKTKFTWG